MLWDKDALRHFDGIYAVVNEIYGALLQYFDVEEAGPAAGVSVEAAKKARHTIFGRADDEFDKRLQAAVADAEQFLRPKLRV